MKKYLISLPVLILAVIFSGCSLAPKSDTNTDQKITVSPSIWKSSDGGRTWEVKNIASAKPGASEWDVLRVAINPNDPNNILVGLKSGGMMVSTDGGERWKPTIFTSEKVYGLELNPNDGRTIYASAVYNGRGKIFKSLDKGENWEEIYTAASDGPLIVAMKLDKNDPQTVYAATSDNLLLKSRDGGGSWKNVFKAEAPIIQIEMDRSDSNLVYILDDDGNVARSKDAGENFSKITPANSNTMFSSAGIKVIKIDPGTSGGVYVAGSNGIFRSSNSGDKWEKVRTLNDPENEPVTTLAINPQDSKKIVYGSSQAAYESVDGGDSWTAFQFDVSRSINVLEYNPQNPDVVWAGFRK